jgi:VWFA-related protein
MLSRSFGLLALVWLLAPAPAATGQSGKPTLPPPPAGQPYTFRVNSRVVLTDVSVTDSRGNPVRGLTEADFRIFDNGRPQSIGSFEEHTAQPAPAGEFDQASAGNVFSNDFAAHPPPVVNVLLIDTTTISLVDQMYLYEQMTRFVRDLPPDEPVAVFLRSGAVVLPIQSFTTNKALLLTAIRESIPHFRTPGYWYRTGEQTLWQIAMYLSQVPGRKNILWFSGGSNLFLSPDPAVTEVPRQPLYDMLEKRRIALYPIDARGLVAAFGEGAMVIGSQQMLMAQDAEATGGRAFYNTNGLAQAAQRILNTDGDYYTLSYAPDDLRQDGKWHKVTVKVDGGKIRCQLSYRRGYYDDGQNNATPEPAMRTLLRRDGSTVQVPDNRSQPIVFQAVVRQADTDAPADIPAKPLKRGETAYRIHYIVPASAIVPGNVNGNVGTVRIGAAILAVNHYGEPITRIAEQATVGVDEARIHADPKAVIVFDQQVNLPHGEDYLDIGLWDMTTGRMGMLSVPVAVSKPKKK